jgi:hypothetical protein
VAVLIVHRDLGFAVWLSRLLDAAQIPTFPAKTVGDAWNLIEELGVHVDLLVLDWTLPGAEELISSLRQGTASSVITILESATRLPPPSFPYDAIGLPPRLLHCDAERDYWVGLVEAAFQNREVGNFRKDAGKSPD